MDQHTFITTFEKYSVKAQELNELILLKNAELEEEFPEFLEDLEDRVLEKVYSDIDKDVEELQDWFEKQAVAGGGTASAKLESGEDLLIVTGEDAPEKLFLLQFLENEDIEIAIDFHPVNKEILKVSVEYSVINKREDRFFKISDLAAIDMDEANRKRLAEE